MNYAFFLFILLFWQPMSVASQAVIKDAFEQSQRASTSKYNVQEGQLLIPMSFGQAVSKLDESFEKLDYKKVKQIELVYTDYPKDSPQESLNYQRFIQLEKLLPGIFEFPSIRWRVVKQTECSTKAQAEQLFHGFVISVEDYPQTLTVDYQKNISLVKEAFLSLPAEDRIFLSMGEDTLAYDVLDRNLGNWKDVTVISDWTASMYPYTTQVLRWHIARAEGSNIQNFVFFNDGDQKKQAEKEIGKTGGLYPIKSSSFEEVVHLMKEVKEKGDGGDLPENDLEAVLFAMEKYPDSQEFVLIADNRSNVRDLELAPKIKRPIHIILSRIVNDDIAYIKGAYIKIALATGGSLHTRSRDYTTKKELEQLIVDILEARKNLRTRTHR